MSDQDKAAARPGAEEWQKVAELAELARREGWTPERTREAMEELRKETEPRAETDETEAR